MPDYQRFANIRQGLSAILQYAGQTATWRAYISASAGLAEFGLGTGLSYVQKPITAVFDPVRAQEIWQAGGTYQAGDLRMATVEPVSRRDEIQWEGNRYHVVSDPISVSLFGTAFSQTVIRRG